MAKPKLILIVSVGAAISLAAFAQSPGNEPPTSQLRKAAESYQRAEALYAEGKIDEAIEGYREALRDAPREAYCHLALGMALVKKGDRQAALDEYRFASGLQPGDPVLRSAYQELQASGPEGGAAETPAERFSGGSARAEGDEIRAPVALFKPEPPYSSRARQANYQGTVVLGVVVDARGKVTSVRVLRPLGLGLDESAVETVRKWKFKPATRKRAPVPVLIIVKFTFKYFKVYS